MHDQIRDAIQMLSDRQNLKREPMQRVIGLLMSGDVPNSDIAQLLTLLHQKGETVEELVGAALAMREHMQPIRSNRTGIVDTCGTGGSGHSTFNISTAAALVAAAAGAVVAKHGNRRSTSRTGSSDVLAELGVNIQAPLSVVERCLNELGVCFCFAPLHHSSVRHVTEVRRSLTHPTIFNLLGPLCNPASAQFQLLGAGRESTTKLLAEALSQLGTNQSIVVHSRDGIGEVSAGDLTDGYLVRDGELDSIEFSPEQFGCARSPIASIEVDSPAASAAMIRDVLAGRRGPAHDVVRMNAAIVLWTSKNAANPEAGFEQADESIRSGRASQLLADLVQMTS